MGVSIRQLSTASGVSRGLLSLMEGGRMIPTAREWDAVTAALNDIEKNGTSRQEVTAQ